MEQTEGAIAPLPDAPPTDFNFYGLSRGIARFGLLVSASMTLTLLARLIPAFTAVYWIAIATALLSLLGYAALCRTDQRPIVLMVLVCVLLGVILGGWDAIAGLLADDSGKALGLKLLLLMGMFALSSAIAQVFFRPRSKPYEPPSFNREGQDLWTDDTSVASWLED